MGKVSDEYHIHYEENKLWKKTKWLGVPIWKNPCDLLILQELIYEIKPDYIIETGTSFGGSAYFFATVLDMMGHGHVLTIDTDDSKFRLKNLRQNARNRVTHLIGNSTDKWIVDQVRKECAGLKNIVILDSWHSEEHVYKELEVYHKFVPVDSYLIVEDTHIGNPIWWRHENRGPGAAVERFLIEHSNFERDYECEKLIFTFNPGGFLKRTE